MEQASPVHRGHFALCVLVCGFCFLGIFVTGLTRMMWYPARHELQAIHEFVETCTVPMVKEPWMVA